MTFLTTQEWQEAERDLLTLRDVIRFGASYFNKSALFFGHGTDNAWDDAVALALHTLHLPHTNYAQAIDTRLTTSERRAVIELYKKRVISRIPTPYLTHEAWFAGLSFYVDERVLIPRSPIAELIEQQFAPWVKAEKVSSILDIGTGSACIAIASAFAFPDARVDAVEISEAALEVARINIAKYQLEDRVCLMQSDVFAEVSQSYDLIVANPPYVDITEMGMLAPEYLHEPSLALLGGEAGLEIVERILQEAAQYLNDKGILIVEVGQNAPLLQEAYPKVPFVWLEFERSDEAGVLLLEKSHLEKFFPPKKTRKFKSS